MSRKQDKERYNLENLEPRILLSGDPLVGALASLAPREADSEEPILTSVQEVTVSEETLYESHTTDSEPYDPAASVDDIFSGMTGEDSLADGADDASDSSDSSDVNFPIGDDEAAQIVQGLDELAGVGEVISESETLTTPLDGLGDLSLGDVFGVGEILDSRLAKSVYDHFGDAVDPPTVEGVIEAIRNGLNALGEQEISVSSLEGIVVSGGEQIRFDIAFTLRQSSQIFLDQDLTDSDGAESTTYTATLKVDLSFGVDQGQSDSFFLIIRSLEIELTVNQPGTGASESGRVEVGFAGAAGADGALSVAELEAIQSSGAELEIEATGSLFDDGSADFASLAATSALTTSGAATSFVTLDESPAASSAVTTNLADLTLGPNSITTFNIGGTTPGSGYDQTIVSGDVTLDGELAIVVAAGFGPSLGDTFDIVTFTGSVSGAFVDGTGIYGFGDGSLFLEVVVEDSTAESDGKVQLEAKTAPGGNFITSSTPLLSDVLGLYYSEYFTLGASVAISGEINIGGYVTLAGTFEFGFSLDETVTLGTGLPTTLTPELVTTVGAQIELALATIPGTQILSPDLQSITGLPVAVLEIGGSNIHAFVGVNGPYWTDLNGNGDVDTGETNESATGLAITNVDFGYVAMQLLPSVVALPLNAQFFQALKATASQVGLVGVPNVELSVDNVLIEVNSGPTWTALGVSGDGPAVVDFEASFLAQTGTDTDGDSKHVEPAGYEVGTGTVPVYIDLDGNERLGASVDNALLSIGGSDGKFVYANGNLSFEKGPTSIVTVATGIPANINGTPAGDTIETNFATRTGLSGSSATLSGDMQTISNVQMASLQIGGSAIQIFVGVNGPYWTDSDKDGNVDPGETSDNATGVSITNVNFGLVTMTPTQELPLLSSQTFTALKLTGSQVGLVGVPGVELSADNVLVEVNTGPTWTATGINGDGPAVVDFAASFSAANGSPAGFEVRTGTTSTPVYIDFDGNERIGASVDNALLSIGGSDGKFVYANGNLSFEKGPTSIVTVATGIPANIVGTATETALRAQFGVATLVSSNVTLSNDLQTINNVQVSGLQIGGSNIQIFAGVNGPYWTDTDKDGNVDPGETSDSATGVSITNVDFGLVTMTPTVELPLLSDQTFTALKLTGSQVGLVGVPFVQLSADNVLVEVNTGPTWTAAGINGDGPAVIDFATSFPAAGGSPAGFEVRAGTTSAPIYIAYDGNERIGVSVDNALLSIGDSSGKFVYVNGDFSFEKGPTSIVSVATGLSSDQLPGVPALIKAQFLAEAFLNQTNATLSADLQTISNVQMSSLQIGGSNIQVFVGLGGPYWTDLDRNDDVSWALPDGTTRTNANGTPMANFVHTDGVTYGDLNGDGVVDANETAELSENATGFAITNVNFGLVMLTPTQELPMLGSQTFTALKLTATQVGLVGIDEVQISANDITVSVNVGPDWTGLASGQGPAVVDFVNSYPAEASNTDSDNDGLLGEPAGFQVRTGTTSAPIYIDFDGNERIGARIEKVTLKISEVVHATGSIEFLKGPVQRVGLTGGGDKQLSFMTIGGSNLHAFIGMDGPYWTDLDADDDISWALPDGTTRTNANGTAMADFIHTDGVTYGDLNGDGKVDANETAELSTEAVGLVINDFDFGLAIMSPTSPFDFVDYFALKASADQIALVGIDDVTISGEDIKVAVNHSSPSLKGIPIFPVVDFSNTTVRPEFANEELALFDQNISGRITLGDLATLNAALPAASRFADLAGVSLTDATPVDHEGLLAILNTNDAGDSRGIIDIDEAAALLGGATAVSQVENADIDLDGKIDPLGFEIGTGGDPVYLDMNSVLIRAQGFVDIKILDVVFLSGSVAFELGPIHTVTLADGVTTKSVSTMTIGAANVTGFIGVDGPYWTDLDGDHEVSWSDANGDPLVDTDGDGVVDANETSELNGDAVGFHVTDLDIGITLMAATALNDLGVYLAAKLDVNSFGLIGIPGLTATGAFEVELNLGFGVSGGVSPIDFDASFNEVHTLFDAIDGGFSGGDGTIQASELNAALAGSYTGPAVTTVDQLLAAMITGPAPPLNGIPIADVQNALSTSFKTANPTAIETADADGDGKIDLGFEVNTGNPASPVVIDFDDFLISIRLGGEIELQDVFRLFGVFIFEADPSNLKAFVAAGLEFGPDVDAAESSKLFTMNALGALVINGAGIAADIDVSVSVGGAMRSVLSLNASARLVFNTTSANQTITIPARFVDFLTGSTDLSALPVSTLVDGSDPDSPLRSLTGTPGTPLDSRFTENADGSATFTIPGGAPRLGGLPNDPAGEYFLVSISGNLTIAQTFVISGAFHLKVSPTGLELGFNGSLDLGGFASVSVAGAAVIENGVFAAHVSLNLNLNVAGGLNISGGAILEINSSNASKTVFEADGITSHTILANTFKVTVTATLNLFNVLTANGTVTLGIVNGNFLIDVNASMNFFGLATLNVTGNLNTNGTFRLSGTLNLDLTVVGFGIDGSIGVTLTESSLSGHGSVGLVIAGQSIPIASASFSLNWVSGTFVIRAEGPLSVFVEVTVTTNPFSFSVTGGLGVLDAVFEALGAAAEAVGEAVVAAAQAVVGAIEDLGEAILDVAGDIVDFVGGFISDIGDVFSSVANTIAGWFSSRKTEVHQVSVGPRYTYGTSLSGGTLTVTNNSSSQLNLAIVGGDLIVDAPDFTESVTVAFRVDYHRTFDSSGWPHTWGWNSWNEVGRTNINRNITFSNTKSFAGVTKIVIIGTNGPETIVLDPASITINADVYGNGGNDTIVTGQGHDNVWGGDGGDIIFTNGGNDKLFGQNGDDFLFGGLGNDELYGGSGKDLLNENKITQTLARSNPLNEISETNILNGADCVKSPSRGSLIRQHRRASTMTDPWRHRSLGAASLFGGVRCCCDWETRDGGGLLRQKRADYPVKPLRRQSKREFLRG